MKIGFVILSHGDPRQLERLCRALDMVYGTPPIACHHDIAQSRLDRSHFGSNVALIVKPEPTGWGAWGVTKGALRALELLYERSDPDWFVLLSAADYPITPAIDVRNDLRDCHVDAFMDLRPLKGPRESRHCGSHDPQLVHHSNYRLARRRYLDMRLTLVPQIAGLSAKRMRIPLRDVWAPFDRSYQCFVGSQWFTANRRSASKLLRLSARDQTLERYMSQRWHADESFINTVLGNAPEITIDINPRRFVRWRPNAPRPELLTESDLAALTASHSHFARKFSHDAPVLDLLDRLLTG